MIAAGSGAAYLSRTILLSTNYLGAYSAGSSIFQMEDKNECKTSRAMLILKNRTFYAFLL